MIYIASAIAGVMIAIVCIAIYCALQVIGMGTDVDSSRGE